MTNDSSNGSSFADKMFYMEYVFGVSATIPALLLLANYVYLLAVLIKQKIWENKPFYLGFIFLGIFDCIMVAILWVDMGLKMYGVDVNANSSIFSQILITLFHRLSFIVYSITSCMLGSIAIVRFPALYFPIFFKEKLDKISGLLAILLALAIGVVPVLIGHFTFLDISYLNSETGEFIVLVNSPIPNNGVYMIVVLLLIPILMNSFIPTILYCAIAVKLYILGNTFNSGEKKIELAFLYTGLLLSLFCFFSGAITTFLFLAPSLEILMPINVEVNLWLVVKISDLIVYTCNPFIYWMVDTTIREIVKPPWLLLCRNTVAPTALTFA